MSREEMNKVFDWLEENMNKGGHLYFKVTDENIITAYMNKGWLLHKAYAHFYVDQVLRAIELEERKNETNK